MGTATIILAAIGAGAAVVAAVAAVKSLRVSKTSVDISTQGVDIATRAARAANNESRRVAYNEISRLVEEIAVATGPARSPGFTGQEWEYPCNQLKHAIMGYGDRLIGCQALADATGRGDAASTVEVARLQVTLALNDL